MLNTVEGIYRNGKIELAETPAEVTEARVIVTFLPAPNRLTPPAAAASNMRQPRHPGSAQGKLTILAEDEEHLRDFQEYLPS
jgi:hypothetical protein